MSSLLAPNLALPPASSQPAWTPASSQLVLVLISSPRVWHLASSPLDSVLLSSLPASALPCLLALEWYSAQASSPLAPWAQRALLTGDLLDDEVVAQCLPCGDLQDP